MSDKARKLLIALLCFSAFSLHIDAAQEHTIEDLWFALHIGGSHVGYMHTVTRRKIEHGREIIETIVNSVARPRRAGQLIEIAIDEVQVEDPGGRLQRFNRTMKLSDKELKISGFAKGDALHVTAESYGKTGESQIQLPPDTLGPYGARELGRRKGLAPGTEYSYKEFSADLMKVVTTTVSVVGPEEVDVLGEKRRLVKLNSKNDAMPITVTIWCDESLLPHKISLPLLGGMESYLTTKERALNITPGELQPDLLVKSFVKSNVDLPDPGSITEALYKITIKGDNPPDLNISFPNQRVERRDQNSIYLRVRSQAAPDAKARPSERRPVPVTAELKEYLADNNYLQWRDEAISKLASEIIGGEADAWKAAKALEGWVYRNVKKDMGTGFATAKEVIENLRGDCTEHATLLAALCRAAGIPSRIAVGLLYADGLFGGHMWTEVYVGEWIGLDATRPNRFLDAVHIKFGDSSLNDLGFAAMFSELGQALGNMQIEVLEYTSNGEKVKVTENR